MTETFEKQTEEIKRDIDYFKNIEFNDLASKFERDLEIINTLIQALNQKACV